MSAEPVAVTGLACRFPGAADSTAFWELLRDGREGLTRFTEADLDARGVSPRLRRHPDYVPAGGLIEGQDEFDPDPFGFSDAEAALLDPQQRLFLECAWHALEHAGHGGGRDAGAVGVFPGSMHSSYLTSNLADRWDPTGGGLDPVGSLQTAIATHTDYLPLQVAYRLDLTAFHRLARDELAPLAAEMDAEERVPRAVLARLAETRLWGALLPAEAGGLDLDMRGFAVLHEEIGRACSSLRSLLGAHSIVAWAIRRWGCAEQVSCWSAPLASGRLLGGFCLTEPDAGSDAAALTATATPTEDGWVLDGHKTWITGGAIAGLFLVFARAPRGVSAFLVAAGTPGLRVIPRTGLLGVRASMPADLELDACPLRPEALLGPEGFGMPTVMMSALDIGRLSVAAGCVGILQACLDASLDHAAHRRHGDRMLGDHQLVRRMIANMATDTAAARLLCGEAARLQDAADPGAIAATWRAKYFASTAATRAAADAVQLHGAAGCTATSVPARCYRDAKIMEIIEGSTEIQQLVIAHEAYGERR